MQKMCIWVVAVLVVVSVLVIVVGGSAAVDLTMCKRHARMLYGTMFPRFNGIDMGDTVPPRFAEAVAQGRARMAKSSVAICGLVRDSEHCIGKMYQRVARLGAMFGRWHAIFFENDSTDATRERLHHLARKHPKHITLIECPEAADCRLGAAATTEEFDVSRSRMQRMAHFRNRYLEEAERGDFDYLVCFDTDLDGAWAYDGIATTFARDDWDAVFANGLVPIPGLLGLVAPLVTYDTLAYIPRAAGNGPAECVQRTFSKNWNFLKSLGGWAKLTWSGNGSTWLPVCSAFNGMAVYKAASIRGLRYSGDDVICEHHALHREMHRAGKTRMFMNPLHRLYVGVHYCSLTSKCHVPRPSIP